MGEYQAKCRALWSESCGKFFSEMIPEFSKKNANFSNLPADDIGGFYIPIPENDLNVFTFNHMFSESMNATKKC